MKKVLVIILGALFVLSFAASAFAIHAEIPSETQAVVGKGSTQITIGGDIRTRGWWTSNIGGLGHIVPEESNDSAWYDERIRLSVDAKVTPNVEGMIEIEGGSGRTYLYQWGNFGAKPAADFGFLQAWIQYSGSGLFGFPAGLKIGHMPLYLGNKTFFDHSQFGDDAIVAFLLPTKEIEIDLLTIKFAGDGQPTPALPELGLPPDALNGSKYDNTDDLDGYVGIVTYKLDDKNTIGVNYTYLNLSDAKFSHQNVEVVANGNISGLGYAVSGDFQFGDIVNNLDAEGWAVQAKLNYMIDPVNLRFSGAYGSGDNDPTDSKDKNFITYLNNDPNYTFVYDYTVATACSSPDGTYGMIHTGLCNTTYLNLGVDGNLTKDLKGSVDGYYLRASKAIGSKNIGWEVDAKVIYNLAKNLVYRVDAGVLFSGDFYKDTFNVQDTKTATVLRHLIELSF